MRPIQVNFAPQTARSLMASILPLQWLLMGIGIVTGLAGWLMLENSNQAQEHQRAQLEQARVHAEVKAAPVEESSQTDFSEAQASAVNSAIRQLNLPWSQILAALEHATPGSIAMLELQPDAKKHLLKGMAETDAPEKMLAYIRRLKNEPFLTNVTLLQHEMSEQGAIRQVRFVFEAEWREVEP
jgi:Tfp pilus assembly protein PilN